MKRAQRVCAIDTRIQQRMGAALPTTRCTLAAASSGLQARRSALGLYLCLADMHSDRMQCNGTRHSRPESIWAGNGRAGKSCTLLPAPAFCALLGRCCCAAEHHAVRLQSSLQGGKKQEQARTVWHRKRGREGSGGGTVHGVEQRNKQRMGGQREGTSSKHKGARLCFPPIQPYRT